MALRIKRHWFAEGKERSPAEMASAVAVTVWKSALNGLQGLRKAKFSVDAGPPYIAVLAEFAVFLVTAADRIVYAQMVRDDAPEGSGWRQAFTSGLARKVADFYEENVDRLLGPAGEGTTHGAQFINLLNQRMAEYADFQFDEQGPEFGFLRLFGSCVEACIDDADDRKWVLDQVMASQGPESIEHVTQAVRGMLGLDPKPRRRGLGSPDAEAVRAGLAGGT